MQANLNVLEQPVARRVVGTSADVVWNSTCACPSESTRIESSEVGRPAAPVGHGIQPQLVPQRVDGGVELGVVIERRVRVFLGARGERQHEHGCCKETHLSLLPRRSTTRSARARDPRKGDGGLVGDRAAAGLGRVTLLGDACHKLRVATEGVDLLRDTHRAAEALARVDPTHEGACRAAMPAARSSSTKEKNIGRRLSDPSYFVTPAL